MMFKENTFYKATHRVNLTFWEGKEWFILPGDIVFITSVSMYSDTEQRVNVIFDFKETKDVIWGLDKCSWLSEIT